MGSEPLKDFTYKGCLRLTFAKIHSKASKQISLAVNRKIKFVFGVAKKKEKREC